MRGVGGSEKKVVPDMVLKARALTELTLRIGQGFLEDAGNWHV